MYLKFLNILYICIAQRVTDYFTKYLINTNPSHIFGSATSAFKTSRNHLKIREKGWAESNKDSAKTWNPVVKSSQISWMSQDNLGMQTHLTETPFLSFRQSDSH